MAISYTLEIAATALLHDVADEFYAAVVATGSMLEEASVNGLLRGASTAQGMWVRLVERVLQPWHPVPADLGFTPTISIGFRLDAASDIRAQQDSMVRISSRLINRLRCDSVLHLNYEQIWLLFWNGELMVSQQDDIWPDHRLALLPLPYRRITHEFAEG